MPRSRTQEVIDQVLAATGGVFPQTQSSRQAVWLHAPLIERMSDDPETVFGVARDNLPILRSRNPQCAGELDEWRDILDSGDEAPARLIHAWTDPGERAVKLRACSPFTGVLSAEEVISVLRAYRSWVRVSVRSPVRR